MLNFSKYNFFFPQKFQQYKKLLFCGLFLFSFLSWSQNNNPSEPSFPIYEFEVKGNSLLTSLKIEKAVTPFTGEKKTIKDVESARLALEKTYHDDGYMTVLVSIPEQSVDTAVVILQVTEASLDKVVIRGAEYTAPSVIRSKLAELSSDKAPNFNVMQEQLAGLNRSNDLKVTPILKQGQLPGTVDVQLDVEDQSPFHGNIEINNRHSANTTPTRLIVGMRYDNLFQMGHSIGFTIQKSPERKTDLTVYAVNYSLPLPSIGGSLSTYAVRSKSEFLSGDLITDGDTAGFRIMTGLKGTDTYSHNTSVGLDYKNQRAFIANENKGPPQYVPLVVSYSGTFLGNRRSTGMELTLTNGLRGMFTNSEVNFNDRGRGASANFSTLKTSFLHTETLWRWTLLGKLDVRASSGILLSPEQMTLGGTESVRGYLEGERVGDHGHRYGLELQTPSATFGSGLSEWKLKGLLFYEGGAVNIIARGSTPASKSQLSSAGLGLRISSARGLSFDADIGHTLVAGSVTPANDNRYSLRAVWNY